MEASARSFGRKQIGGSAVGLIVTLAVIAYGVYVAIQFIPQHLEWITVSDVLDKVQETHRMRPIRQTEAVWTVVDKQLYINEASELKTLFDVGPGSDGSLAVSVDYERPLNLLFTEYPLRHARTVELH